MKIAIIRTRGVPARYGGFETCAEELSVGLVNKGHKVIVTCRKYLYPEKFKYYKGVKLIYLPSIRGKFTDTFSHTFLSILRALFESPDIILIFNSANSPFAIIGKISWKKNRYKC
jgi:glycosyltransferase involved in cell wall biosynthesis